MSRYLSINDQDEPAFVASNAGWTQLLDWFDAAPEEDRAACPDLAAFLNEGGTDQAAAVNDQLSQLASAHEADDDVQGIIDTLTEFLATTAEGANISITA
jgi:hypothetical protein